MQVWKYLVILARPERFNEKGVLSYLVFEIISICKNKTYLKFNVLQSKKTSRKILIT